MSIFPRLNQRTKVILPIRTNLSEYNEIPEHTVISANTEIPSVEDGPTVVQRYRNLTINAGCTLTTQYRCCGLALVVDGDLTVHGTISMTARGAKYQPSGDHGITNDLLPGNEVYYEIDIPATADEIAAFLLKEKRRYHSLDELPAIYRPTLYARGPLGNVYAPADLAFIPAVGASGALGALNASGIAGSAGTNRQCGGGGSGGARSATGGSGDGTAGTCYSGGTGGGGRVYNPNTAAVPYGGSGGTGATNNSSVPAGGGAGNPGGAGEGTGGTAGGTGTGGLLIILCTGTVLVSATGAISSLGSKGGGGTTADYSCGGGGSGGGSVNVFYGALTNNGTISAAGGAAGSAYRIGGAGGAGCVTLDQYNF